jgi:hypothetical protein
MPNVALELAEAFFTERIALDAPPTHARRPMTKPRAYTTLHLLDSAPLVVEASYAALRVSGLTTEQQRALDEAIARIRHIPATEETPSLDTS